MNNQPNKLSANIKEFDMFRYFKEAYNKNTAAYKGAFFTLKGYDDKRVIYGYLNYIKSKIISASPYAISLEYTIGYFEKNGIISKEFSFYSPKYDFKVEVELNNKRTWLNLIKRRGGTRKITNKARRNRSRRH